MESFSVRTSRKEEFVDITSRVRGVVDRSGVSKGICVVFVPHTTAGVTINENADPSVMRDITKGLRFIPQSGYDHAEGNSPAHIRSSLVGQSLTVIVEGGSIVLGTWQGIYFAEFDGPRSRSVMVKVIKG